ncbi:uncharacterized protein CC84DRAFT_1204231 [Paraphaeosphaeria sporulosa]|uniref:Uncharacterized protein n=1 Tax=Paraphaeosphaeria sporulosa TaxID=1460663 RepID=A0A177CND2_9PLEO|nr:uncharacterized protein CC84DRAFT_1204231 [Paraphaeosphaeria sporulosa]OAG09045.1 hypothetical protein CC84DRAFT_1204231 [Paraphaeosphaeria sporulosa]
MPTDNLDVEVRLRPNSTSTIRARSTRPELGFERSSKTSGMSREALHGMESLILTLAASSRQAIVRRALERRSRPGRCLSKRHERARAVFEIRGKCKRSAANHFRVGGWVAQMMRLGEPIAHSAWRCTSGQEFCLDSAPIAEQPCEVVPLPLRNVPSQPSADATRNSQIRPGCFAQATNDLRCPMTHTVTSSAWPMIPILITVPGTSS